MFPPYTFNQLLFGRRTLADLRYMFPDCWADDEAAGLSRGAHHCPRVLRLQLAQRGVAAAKRAAVFRHCARGRPGRVRQPRRQTSQSGRECRGLSPIQLGVVIACHPSDSVSIELTTVRQMEKFAARGRFSRRSRMGTLALTTTTETAGNRRTATTTLSNLGWEKRPVGRGRLSLQFETPHLRCLATAPSLASSP